MGGFGLAEIVDGELTDLDPGAVLALVFVGDHLVGDREFTLLFDEPAEEGLFFEDEVEDGACESPGFEHVVEQGQLFGTGLLRGHFLQGAIELGGSEFGGSGDAVLEGVLADDFEENDFFEDGSAITAVEDIDEGAFVERLVVDASNGGI